MRRLAISALVLALLPLCAAAQQDEPKADQTNITPALGLHYGSPMRISAVLGVIVAPNRHSHDGLLLLVEPGQKGAEASVGYLHMIGRFGTGVSARASVLRTGSDPWDANAKTTYVGAELHWMIVLGVGGRAGLFRRVSGDPGSHDGLATIGLSLGM